MKEILDAIINGVSVLEGCGEQTVDVVVTRRANGTYVANVRLRGDDEAVRYGSDEHTEPLFALIGLGNAIAASLHRASDELLGRATGMSSIAANLDRVRQETVSP